MNNDRWIRPSSSSFPKQKCCHQIPIQPCMNTYEEPEDFYSKPPDFDLEISPPPSLPPVTKSLKAFDMSNSICYNKQLTRQRTNYTVLVLSILLATVSLLLCSFIIYSVLFNYRFRISTTDQCQKSEIICHSKMKEPKKKVDVEVNANYLLTLLITQRKVCLLEAGTDRVENSRAAYLNEHIESAKLFYYQNVSESGAPVHPLQFQQFMRTLGIDSDCHVIIYDRGELIWATYGHWIFTLFGHEKVSILSGGFERWKMLQRTSPQYRTVNGIDNYVQRSGNFQAKWNQDVICTFDDVITNLELQTYTLIDAQNKEEYNGISKGAIFGHIKSAINIPVNTVYSWTEQKWVNNTELQKIFEEKGMQHSKPAIVYCSTSVRASMIWFALQKANYSAMIYYGSWPEWLIKAPDYLKITPEHLSA